MPTLEFKGKQFVYTHHLSVPFRTLEVDPTKSLPKENRPSLNDNLIIRGDNLHALKALLPTYAGKVKCIYIDPPYNTGNEGWCYNDRVNAPLIREWLKKEANPVDKEDLERHDKWLCMMWPRLQLLKELLADDGVIFISIDDNEVHHLRMLMDEILGEDKLIAEIVVQANKRGQTYKEISKNHEYLLVYSLSEKTSIHEIDKDADSLPFSDSNGSFDLWELRNRNPKFGKHNRPNLYFPIYIAPGNLDECGYSKVSLTQSEEYCIEVLPKNSEGKDSCWRWSKEKINTIDLKADSPVLISKKRRDGEWNIYEKSRKMTTKLKSIWDDVKFISEQGTVELKELKLADNFIYPKPSELIKQVIKSSCDDGDIILDSFAGSGTTAHAVLAINKEDGGNRKFILVEMEDYADQVTAERVRRVIRGVPSAKDEALKEGLGGSFTYCTLGEEINIASLLKGESVPSYEALARYVFYTAIGKTLDDLPKLRPDWRIGETDLYTVHLIYQPDREFLRSQDAALNAEMVDIIAGGKGKKAAKKALVFAAVKFMGQKELTERNIEFCQLPYAIHRILGD